MTRLPILVLVVGAALTAATSARAAAPTLDGVRLVNATAADPTSNCTDDGELGATIRYRVAGNAFGAYPGTFTETGVARITAENPVTGRGTLLSLSATFTITSSAGVVSGTKTFAAGETTGNGRCEEFASNAIVIGNQLRYTATLPDGTTDEGLTSVSFFDTAVVGSFEERYVSTRVAEPQPTLSIADVTVAEGDEGTAPAAFTLALSAAASATVTVGFATSDGTAVAGEDYHSSSGTVTFSPGETAKDVAVAIVGDTLDEPDETVQVDLSNASGATIADARGIGTIADDDATPPPATPCITVEPANGIGFGTAPFSTASAVETRPGAPAVTVTSCSTADEVVTVRATNASGDGASWTLDDSVVNPCDAGANVFGLSLGSLRLATTNKQWATLSAGAGRDEIASILMPCAGSDGTGVTLTSQLVFTATT